MEVPKWDSGAQVGGLETKSTNAGAKCYITVQV